MPYHHDIKTSTMDQQPQHSLTGITLAYILLQTSRHSEPVKC